MTTEGGQTSRFERICTTDGQSLPLVVLRPFVLLRSISLHFEYVNKFGFPLLLGGSLSLSLSLRPVLAGPGLSCWHNGVATILEVLY